jgi:hypothetical protein
MSDLNQRERTVLDCIPAGHENAISLRRLTLVVALGDRLIREIIYRLVVERGLPIGSSTVSEGGGYFLIENEEDLKVATRHLKPRAKAIFRRTRALERIAREKFSRQIKLTMMTDK